MFINWKTAGFLGSWMMVNILYVMSAFKNPGYLRTTPSEENELHVTMNDLEKRLEEE
jgi:hypothetical protein